MYPAFTKECVLINLFRGGHLVVKTSTRETISIKVQGCRRQLNSPMNCAHGQHELCYRCKRRLFFSSRQTQRLVAECQLRLQRRRLMLQLILVVVARGRCSFSGRSRGGRRRKRGRRGRGGRRGRRGRRSTGRRRRRRRRRGRLRGSRRGRRWRRRRRSQQMTRWQLSQKSQLHWQVSVGESVRGLYIIYRERREEKRES